MTISDHQTRRLHFLMSPSPPGSGHPPTRPGHQLRAGELILARGQKLISTPRPGGLSTYAAGDAGVSTNSQLASGETTYWTVRVAERPSLAQLVIVSNRVAVPEKYAKARAGGLEVAVKAALAFARCLNFVLPGMERTGSRWLHSKRMLKPGRELRASNNTNIGSNFRRRG
jgi:hypothetical protein